MNFMEENARLEKLVAERDAEIKNLLEDKVRILEKLVSVYERSELPFFAPVNADAERNALLSRVTGGRQQNE